MEFLLTEKNIEDILFAMENQELDSLFDSEKGEVVVASSIAESDFSLDENEGVDRFYNLPNWSSVEGFKLMESFALTLHNPVVAKKLRQVLDSGKGVFRNYKNVLAEYPDVHKLWFVFKSQAMKKVVLDWYNDLRFSWSLAPFEDELCDDAEDIVLSEFSFEENVLSDMSLYCAKMEDVFVSDKKSDLGKVFYQQWRDSITQRESFACFSGKNSVDEIVGVLHYSYSNKNNPSVVVLNLCFVEPLYRGLGIAKTLLEKSLDALREKGVQWIVIESSLFDDSFNSFVKKQGFSLYRGNFVLNIGKK